MCDAIKVVRLSHIIVRAARGYSDNHIGTGGIESAQRTNSRHVLAIPDIRVLSDTVIHYSGETIKHDSLHRELVLETLEDYGEKGKTTMGKVCIQ